MRNKKKVKYDEYIGDRFYTTVKSNVSTFISFANNYPKRIVDMDELYEERYSKFPSLKNKSNVRVYLN